jgi:hypothetical protein
MSFTMRILVETRFFSDLPWWQQDVHVFNKINHPQTIHERKGRRIEKK